MPVLRTDEEAERFVATADLSEYDLSRFVVSPIDFVDPPRANVPVPADLLRRIEEKAEREGTSADRFIATALENALSDDFVA